MSVPYFRMSDANLIVWSNAFSAHLTATPVLFGVTADQASAYAIANAKFEAAVNVWRDNATRTPVAMDLKTAARENLLRMAKHLGNSIKSNPATTPAQREELGISARKTPSPVPVPEVSPAVEVIAVRGRVVTIGLGGGTGGSRWSRPAGVAGASVFTFVGATAPTDPTAWTFYGLFTRTMFDLQFEPSTVANTVWVTANWYNERGKTGVACSPKSINLPAATVVPQTNPLKIAA